VLGEKTHGRRIRRRRLYLGDGSDLVHTYAHVTSTNDGRPYRKLHTAKVLHVDAHDAAAQFSGTDARTRKKGMSVAPEIIAGPLLDVQPLDVF
jgi:hypothetical protein